MLISGVEVVRCINSYGCFDFTIINTYLDTKHVKNT